MPTDTHDSFFAAVAAHLPPDIRENIRRDSWWNGDDYLRRLESYGLAASFFDGKGTKTIITDFAKSVARVLRDPGKDPRLAPLSSAARSLYLSGAYEPVAGGQREHDELCRAGLVSRQWVTLDPNVHGNDAPAGHWVWQPT